MKRIISLGIILILTLSLTGQVFGESESSTGKYTTMKDEAGRIITRTAHPMVLGDRYLNSNNQLYQVTRIQGNTVIAKLVKSDEGPWNSFKKMFSAVFNLSFFRAEVRSKGPICIYHTHSDESYVPSDGTSSKEAHGGVFQVGDSLTKAFEAAGVPVVHSKTPHDPHDAMAYDRSRRTAAQFLKKGPICLLDVHRDAVPASEYSDVVNNKPVTKVQLVVGRQNPNFQANDNFAKQIKAAVDRKYPGFIKGIFYGKGKYNQDLGPRCALLEFGTDTNSKESAERAAGIFAAAAKEVVYGTTGNTGSNSVNRGSLRSLFWILAAVVGGVGLFLLINKRGLKNIKEFTGAVGEADPEDEQNKDGQDSNSGNNDQD